MNDKRSNDAEIATRTIENTSQTSSKNQTTNTSRILTVNGKVLDEDATLDLAELFPPYVLGAKNQTNVRRWICKHCSRVYFNISSYAKHLREHYKCKQMPKRTVHEDNIFECDICDKHFKQKFFLYRHLQRHTGEFTCSMCLTIYSRKTDLITHQKNCKDLNDSILHCVICKITLQTRRELRQHLISIHSSAQFNKCLIIDEYCAENDNTNTCPYCERSYSKKHLLINHIKNKHDTYGNDLDKECFTCNMKFNSKTSAARHRLLHTHGKIYNCPDCDKSFVTDALRKQHAVKHSLTSYLCPYCETVVRYKHTMMRHIKNYHFDHLHLWNSTSIEKLKGNMPLKKLKLKRGHTVNNLRPIRSQIICDTETIENKVEDTCLNNNLIPIRSKIICDTGNIENKVEDTSLNNNLRPIRSKIICDTGNIENKIEDTSLNNADNFIVTDYPGDKYCADDLSRFSIVNIVQMHHENNCKDSEGQIFMDVNTGQLFSFG